jgi:hypothetical protein
VGRDNITFKQGLTISKQWRVKLQFVSCTLKYVFTVHMLSALMSCATCAKTHLKYLHLSVLPLKIISFYAIGYKVGSEHSQTENPDIIRHNNAIVHQPICVNRSKAQTCIQILQH